MLYATWDVIKIYYAYFFFIPFNIIMHNNLNSKIIEERSHTEGGEKDGSDIFFF